MKHIETSSERPTLHHFYVKYAYGYMVCSACRYCLPTWDTLQYIIWEFSVTLTIPIEHRFFLPTGFSVHVSALNLWNGNSGWTCKGWRSLHDADSEGPLTESHSPHCSPIVQHCSPFGIYSFTRTISLADSAALIIRPNSETNNHARLQALSAARTECRKASAHLRVSRYLTTMSNSN